MPSRQHTVVIPKEGQTRFAKQASNSVKFAIVWAADNRNKTFWDLEGYLEKLALLVTWPSFGNPTVLRLVSIQSCPKGRCINVYRYLGSKFLVIP
jgi:hypothetical protein